MDHAIEQQLERLLLEDEQFANLERALGQFCPFDAMGIVRAEIRHGTFLSRMIDPHIPHGFGGSLLRALLMAAIRTARSTEALNTQSVSPLTIHLLDFEDSIVFREWKNIDIVIESKVNQIVIAIELKINSYQSPGQLRRYRKIIDTEFPADYKKLLIFLTKNEEIPEDLEVSHWIPLALENLVQEFEKTVASEGGSQSARDMFLAYLAMLRREHVKNDYLDRLVRELWARHGTALTYLTERKPDALASLMEQIASRRDEIVEGLDDETKGTWECEDAFATIIRFAYRPWDKIENFQKANWTNSSRFLLFEIKREGNCISGCLYMGPGPDEYRKPIADKLKLHKLAHPKNRFGSIWTCLNKKKWLYDNSSDEHIDESAFNQVKQSFINFARESVDHFNPHLSTIDLPN